MSEPPEEPPESEDGTVLSPDELDITSEESVIEIGESRYVISPGEGTPTLPEEQTDDLGEEENDLEEDTPRKKDIDSEEVHEWLESHLKASESEYAFDVTARFEGQVEQSALYSNDVVATFESLVKWYAHHVGEDTPVEEVLGLLLIESTLSVKFPVESLINFASSHGLDDSDSISKLYDATREAGGITFRSSR